MSIILATDRPTSEPLKAKPNNTLVITLIVVIVVIVIIAVFVYMKQRKTIKALKALPVHG